MTDEHRRPADRFDLERFVDAQASTFDSALAELHAGRKRSHWMWFVFPQFRGLGRSAMADRYAIGSLEEALAYLDHPILGPRLRSATEAVLVHAGRHSLARIFGSPDDLKFRSSMTLFERTRPDLDSPYRRALDQCCDGRADPRTLDLIRVPV